MRNRSKSKTREYEDSDPEPGKVVQQDSYLKHAKLVPKEDFQKCCNQSRNLSFVAAFFILSVCILLTALNIFELRRIDADRLDIINELIPLAVQNYTSTVIVQKDQLAVGDDRPICWIWTSDGKQILSSSPHSSFKHIILVLQRLGYQFGTHSSKWDLLWAHDFPFNKLKNVTYDMLPHQKVNHFPGIGHIANKYEIATSGDFVPKSFKLPKDADNLKKYAETRPKQLFVEKGTGHRGVKIQNISSMDLNRSDVFVQEYVSKPFLVDGYRFDIGVYVIITSIKPLRIYAYYGDALFRYCPTKYYPFDPLDLDKYVVGDDYLPTWEVPALQTWYVDQGMSMKDSFDAYVRSRNKDPTLIWNRINKAIGSVCQSKAELVYESIKGYKSKMENFYELIRFDFIVDDDLKVFLMEANMSPNLSSAHFKPNELLYEQVLFNALGLVGIGTKIQKPIKRTILEQQMQAARKNIAVLPEVCVSEDCKDGKCDDERCQLCQQCLSKAQTKILEESYKEFVNRGECVRLFPPKMPKNEDEFGLLLKNLSKEDQWMHRWFYGKCQLNEEWC